MVILALMCDTGSFQTIFPVGAYLESIGQEVIYRVYGQAENLLKKEGRAITEYSGEMGEVRAVVSGMSNKPFEYQLAKDFKDSCPIIAIPDQWTTPFFAGGWEAKEIFPDIVCVNDNIGRRAVREWGFNGLVTETGWPMLDQYYNFDVLRKRAEIRKRLGFEGKLIFFVGQGEGENTEALQELLEALAEENKFEAVKVAPRQHPNAVLLEKENWDRLIARWGDSGLIMETDQFNSKEILLAADLVVSDFSTMLTEAVICGIPAVAVLYPQKPSAEKLRKWEWSQGTFPLAALECCPVAAGRDELGQLLVRALKGEEWPYKDKAGKVFRMDGENTAQVARVVEMAAGM